MFLTHVLLAAISFNPAQILEDEELSLDEKTAAFEVEECGEEWAFLFEEEELVPDDEEEE
jgi:hypothetical protein